MNPIEVIRERLQSTFAPLQLEVRDTSAAHAGHHHRHTDDASGHYEIVIVSTAFAGQARLARHRAIYAALGDLMRTHVHALAIDARTPEE